MNYTKEMLNGQKQMQNDQKQVQNYTKETKNRHKWPKPDTNKNTNQKQVLNYPKETKNWKKKTMNRCKTIQKRPKKQTQKAKNWKTIKNRCKNTQKWPKIDTNGQTQKQNDQKLMVINQKQVKRPKTDTDDQKLTEKDHEQVRNYPKGKQRQLTKNWKTTKTRCKLTKREQKLYKITTSTCRLKKTKKKLSLGSHVEGWGAFPLSVPTNPYFHNPSVIKLGSFDLVWTELFREILKNIFYLLSSLLK